MHRKPLFCSTGLYILFPELFARHGMFRVRVGSTAFSTGRRSADPAAIRKESILIMAISLP